MDKLKTTSCYTIENTINLHNEQLSGEYLNPNFWSTFYNDMEQFKTTLINHREQKIPFVLIRIGHSEFSLFNSIIPDKQNVGNLIGRHCTHIPDKHEFINYYESLINSDYITTQIGVDFKAWLNTVTNYKIIYLTYKYSRNEKNVNYLFNNLHLFNENHVNYEGKELMNMPLDIIYGLCANKWFLRTFKNKIGLIGSHEKMHLIKELMKHEEYRNYVENDYFTDYIGIIQKGALNNTMLNEQVEKQIKESTCDIFLCGVGCYKLAIFHKLKKIKNIIFIDIGCGICSLAGCVDIRRPYFGSWNNYRLNDYDYSNVEQIDWDYGLKLKNNNNQILLE